jgi:hypothetical protein
MDGARDARAVLSHGIPASFVLPQDLRHELAFGQFAMLSFYVVIGDIDPEFEGLVHS